MYGIMLRQLTSAFVCTYFKDIGGGWCERYSLFDALLVRSGTERLEEVKLSIVGLVRASPWI
jgi:hypothetical protein